MFAGYEGIGLGSVYSPRMNIVQLGQAVSASIGTHAALAITARNSRHSGANGGSTGFIGIESPIMFELNFGRKSHPKNENSIGGFIGNKCDGARRFH